MVVMRTGSWSTVAPPGVPGVMRRTGAGPASTTTGVVGGGGAKDTGGGSPGSAGRPGTGAGTIETVLHLRRIELRRPTDAPDAFPFDLPALRGVTSLELRAPVTILVGENGSGKSTLLEAVAIAARAITAGSADAVVDPTLDGVRTLAHALRLTWSKRPAPRLLPARRGLLRLRPAARRHARRAGGRAASASSASTPTPSPTPGPWPPARCAGSCGPCATATATASTRAPTARRSCTSSPSALVPGGIYFLDEPEAPLSPSRQLSFLSLLHGDGAGRLAGASWPPTRRSCWPIPGADLLSFDASPLARVAYDDLEHVTLTRDFLRDPAAFLRHL